MQVRRVQLRSHQLRHEASRGRNITDVGNGVEQLTGIALRGGERVRRGRRSLGRETRPGQRSRPWSPPAVVAAAAAVAAVAVAVAAAAVAEEWSWTV